MHFALKAASDEAEAQRASQASGSTPANTGTPGKRTPAERARLAALARWGKYKGKGKGKGKAPKAAKPTPEEKEAAARQEAQANRQKLLGENSAAMDALAMGQEPDPMQAQALVDDGLADKLKDGTIVLNSAGRQLYNAASQDDAGRVRELQARAKDSKLTADEKLKAKDAPKEEEKPKGGGGGGGGGGKDKPTPEEKEQQKQADRQQRASDTATRVGLAAADLEALTQGRDAGGADSQRMRDIGLLDANGDTTDQGRRALLALERGDVGQFRAALQDARSRLAREAQARQRALDKMIKDAENDKPKETRRTNVERNGIVVTTRETKDTDMEVKYSRRHSATDESHLQRAMQHTKATRLALIDAGASDEDVAENEIKALDLHTQHELVCAAILDTLDDDADGECDITVYAEYAVFELDGEAWRIPYEIVAGDVELSEPSEWDRVTWDVSVLEDADSYEDAHADDEDTDAPRMVIGDAVKSLDTPDRIAGYAIRFGSADEPDLSQMRDYFTKSTDFWLDAWQTRPILYHHAQDPATADTPVIGTWVKAMRDDVGIWLEGQLDKSHKYYAAIKELVQRGALKLSSDSAPHLVRRARTHDDVHEVTRWPLMAASLTPTPAEPRLLNVTALKTLSLAGLPPLQIDNPDDDALEVADATKSDRARLLALELELIECALVEVA